MNLRQFFAASLLFAALTFGPPPAHANNDAVQFGSNIDVPEGSSVHDAVCFFCSVNAKGAIDHDVVVFFGNVHIASVANHDVVTFFGNIHADDNATIKHDLVSFFGVIRLGENVSVGGDMVAMFGAVHAADSASVGRNRVVEPAWVLWIPLLIVGGIIWFVVHEVRMWRHRQLLAAGYPFPPPPPPPAQRQPPQPQA